MTIKQLEEQIDIISETRETIGDLAIHHRYIAGIYSDEILSSELHTVIGNMIKDLYDSLGNIQESLNKNIK